MPGVAGSALITGRTGLRVLRPVSAPADLIETQNRVREFVVKVLREDTDYGLIPGTKGKSLLKPGAEKITAGFGCVAVPRIVEQEVDHFREVRWHKQKKDWVTGEGGRREQVWVEQEGVSFGLYRYVVAIDIVDQDGIVRGTGLGSCCSLESKYCDRPRDVENTILKMARKRAHVGAVLDAFGLSDEFKDLSDQEGEGDEDDAPAAAAGAPRAKDEPLFPMPFGKTKGQALADLDTKDIKSALDWNLKTCPEKFGEFQKEAKAELERRAAKAVDTLTAKPEPKAAPSNDFAKAPALEAEDELPFD